MIAYLRLFRVDAALIAFVSYLIGAELAGKARWQDVAVAALVTCIYEFHLQFQFLGGSPDRCA